MATSSLVFDPFRRDFVTDPYGFYARLRNEAPAFECVPGFWLVSRFSHCSEFSRDQKRFGRQGLEKLRGGAPPKGRSLGAPFHLLDPPEHTRIRKLALKAFTPRVVDRLRARVQESANQYVDQLVADVAEVFDALDPTQLGPRK
jgi:cytochrome P450